MNEVFRTDQVAVFDDVLPQQEFAATWRFVQDADYRHVQQAAITAVYRVGDGNPLIGRPIYACSPRSNRKLLLAKIGGEDAASQVFPTGHAVDFVVRRLLRTMPKLASLVGREGPDWGYLTACPYIYPQETGLSWHWDGHATGAFTYYAHREWNVTWGGELLVAHESRGQKDYDNFRRNFSVHRFDNQAESDYLLKIGAGQYIMPKPNRLVVMAGGIAHAIAQVNRSAGNRVRASIAGFFVRRQKAT